MTTSKNRKCWFWVETLMINTKGAFYASFLRIVLRSALLISVLYKVLHKNKTLIYQTGIFLGVTASCRSSSAYTISHYKEKHLTVIGAFFPETPDQACRFWCGHRFGCHYGSQGISVKTGEPQTDRSRRVFVASEAKTTGTPHYMSPEMVPEFEGE